DFYVVRENTEGEYSSVGGKMFEGTEREVVIQETVMTRHGTDRVLKYAFDLAQSRPRQKLTSATKSNGIAITMPWWDERVAAMGQHYPEVTVDQFHIDILTAHFVMHPDWFDVVVASNLFGDILSDLVPACTGTIPAADMRPDGTSPIVFGLVPSSAAEMGGRRVGRPSGPSWCGAMLREPRGHQEAGNAIVAASEALLAACVRSVLSPDIGGQGTTE